MANNIIMLVALMLISGIVMGRAGKKIKLPNVTGYLVAGLILGPSFLNIISLDLVDDFEMISDMALAFIAFSVGLGFKITYFKKVGPAPIIIAICESFGAIIFVTGFLILFHQDVKLSIMLGAIAAATAPAQTIMVIQQYKSKGSLTRMLLSVVALDDAVALIGFGIATTIVKSMSSADVNIIISILKPILEIIVSVIIGIGMGFVLKIFLRHFKKETNRLPILIGTILATYYLAVIAQGSALMACMALGAIMINISAETNTISDILSGFTPPIYMIFFIISGAGFEISALESIGLIGLIYVIVRVIGKMGGAYIGGKLTKQEDKICKYLGPTLMPQAGVALGLMLLAGDLVPDYSAVIKTTIICSTFVYSFAGPVVAKIALEKAGEIKIDTPKPVPQLKKPENGPGENTKNQ